MKSRFQPVAGSWMGTLVVLSLLANGACERARWRPLEHWQRVDSWLASPVYDLIRDPTDPDVIYAACGWQAVDSAYRRGGVLRSSDRGSSWQEANEWLPRSADVLTLAIVPASLLAAEVVGEATGTHATILMAGTRRAGLFVSANEGSSWSALPELQDPLRWDQLTLQTLVVLPGEPPALAVGSSERGVLVSEDGGLRWEPRSTGLQNPSVRKLVLGPDASLLAATWYGGLYRSTDRGQRWESLTSEYERASLAAMAMAEDGTLWLGLQNGGLLAAEFEETSPLVFEHQGASEIGDVGVMALASAGPRLLVGTSGHGAALGRLGGRFETIDRGLENPTVSAVLLASDDPTEVLVGTLSGIYRGVPSPSPVPKLIASGLAFVVLIGLVWTGWRRSDRAAGRAFYLEFVRQPPELLAAFWDRRIAELPRDRAPAVLLRVSELMARSQDPVQLLQSRIATGTAKLYETFNRVAGRTDRDSRGYVADVLESRADEFERLADRLESLGQALNIAAIAHRVARQDALYAQFLRSENLGHLTVLRQGLSELEAFPTDIETSGFFDMDSGRALGELLETLDHLGRVSSTDDRALYLGRALSRTLAALDRRNDEALAPSHRRIIGTYVLEGLRELLATALQNIHQRAELRVTLRSKRLTTQREAVVVLELKNVGQGHAQNLAVELRNGEGFRALRRRRELRSLLRGQSARLEFLVEPQVSDRVRLRFRIEYDDLERPRQRREFADLVEFRRLGEHRTFTPLRPNPYVVGRPLVESDIFMGRKDIFEHLEASLRGAHQDNVVVLMGSRRMGKTSILRRLHEHLGADYLPVLIDLQGMIGSGESSFFRELTAVLHDELEEAGFTVPEPSPGDFEIDPGGAFRRRFLKAVRGALGTRRLLLLFDEFEVLEARIRNGDLEPRVLPYFRSLMQHERSVSFVFAGTHRLDELTRDYWGVLFNLAIYLEVGHLSRAEVQQLFVEPTRGYFEIDPLALDKAFQLTGGHPHFSQLLARELVELRNQHRLSYLTIQDLNEVADRVSEKGQLHISYLWEDGSRGEQLFLLALKERLERTGMATLGAVQNSLDNHAIEFFDPTVALRQLVRREIVEDNAGLLSFRIELLRLWLDRHHDLENFVFSEHRTGES